jgi:hypothetical protein
MYEVVWVVQMDFGIAQAPGGIALLGSLPGADDTHALLPKARAGGQVIKYLQLIISVAQV